jgi:hypothetical protein
MTSTITEVYSVSIITYIYGYLDHIIMYYFIFYYYYVLGLLSLFFSIHLPSYLFELFSDRLGFELWYHDFHHPRIGFYGELSCYRDAHQTRSRFK